MSQNSRPNHALLGKYPLLLSTIVLLESGSDSEEDVSEVPSWDVYEQMFSASGWTEEDFEDGELDGTAYDPRGNEAYSDGSDSSEDESDSEDSEGGFDGSDDLEDAEIARQSTIFFQDS